MAEEQAKVLTKITSFQDCEKSFQNIQNILNDLLKATNTEAETEVTDREGKSGDTRITQNADKTYTFEIRTEDGWKFPKAGEMPVKFADKLAEKNVELKKSIDEIESDDTSTGAEDAKKTIFDEKADKFILPRPDYDSGWTLVGTTALTHSLDTIQFSLIQISHNNAADNTSHQINNNDIATITTNGSIAVTAAFPGSELTHYRVRLWK